MLVGGAYNQAVTPGITRTLHAPDSKHSNLKANHWIIFKDYSARCIVNKANETMSTTEESLFHGSHLSPLEINQTKIVKHWE